MMTSPGASPSEANRQFERRSNCTGRVDTGLEWLGEIPEHWELRPLQYCLIESKLRNGPRPVGEMLSVSGYSGVSIKEYDHEAKKRSAEDLKNYRVVQPGQLVVNSMWLNHGGLGVSQHEGHVSPAYEVYSIEDDLHEKYVHYLMRSTRYVDRYKSLLYGIRPNSLQIKSSDWDSIPLLVPPLHEQRAIANYLNLRTTAIDKLIAKKERLIELLEEKCTALITQAVTKGLNPDVPMKDSGVEWLGEIPASWEATRLRRVADVIDCKHKTPTYVDDGYPLVSTTEVKPGILELSRCTRFVTREDLEDMVEGARRPGPGDLIYSRNASLGQSALVTTDEEFCMGQDVVLIRSHEMIPRFLNYQLNSPVATRQVEAVGVGSTFSRINVSTIRDLVVISPPLHEQRAVVDEIERHASQNDSVQDQATSAIELLTEYRSALITAAVTGKIDVRDHAA